jgi:hypothetical protein
VRYAYCIAIWPGVSMLKVMSLLLASSALLAVACSSADDARPPSQGESGGALGAGARSTLGSGGSSGSGGSLVSSGGTRTSGGTGGSTSSGGISAGGSSGAPRQCPGAQPTPPNLPTCRKPGDCPSGTFGCSRSQQTACGFCQPPPTSECDDDAACGANRVCESYTFTGGCLCNGPPGPLKHCLPPCAVGTCGPDDECAADGHCKPRPCAEGASCAAGRICAPARVLADARGCAPLDCSLGDFQCPADSPCKAGEGCVPVLCTEGYQCPFNHVCDATSPLPHGCVRRACQTDAACDCGACITSVCEDGLFVCSPGAP